MSGTMIPPARCFSSTPRTPAARWCRRRPRPTRTGYLYIVNRQTGALIRRSDPLVLESRQHMALPNADLGEPHYPSASGGANWSPPAYSPLTHKVYVNAANVAWMLQPPMPPIRRGPRIGGEMRVDPGRQDQLHH